MKIGSSRLKAKMGQYLRAVRAGREVVVTDRDRPIARLVPFEETRTPGEQALVVVSPKDPGAPPLGQVEVRSIEYRGRPSLERLMEDRARR